MAVNRMHPGSPQGASEDRRLWDFTANARPQTEELAGDAKADVVVIGGGFTGLTAALNLAQRGLIVRVLEAGRIGGGASGANAGFVVPNFAKADPATTIAALGDERGRRLLALVGAGGDRVFELARMNAIDCDAQQTGWLQPAHSADLAAALAARAAMWQSLGRPVSFISAAETAHRTGGMAGYHGALLDRSGGTIHPVNYALGLARAALAHGVAIHEGTPVASVERDGTGWMVSTPGGRVRADRVLLCTNAETGGVARRLGGAAVPLPVYQIATAPLPQDVVDRISPDRQPMSDTRGYLFTYRLDAENRLISGGMAILPFAAHARMGRAIVARLASELRLPEIPQLDFVWRGTAAMTTDFLPHLYEFGPGFIGGLGCNGRGIAMTAMLGGVLADAATGTKLADLPIPLAPAKQLPMRQFAALAVAGALIQARVQDWRARTFTSGKSST